MAATRLLRPGHIIRARGESWVVHRHIAGALGSIVDVRGRGADNRGVRATFLLPYEPIEHLPSSDTPRIVRPDRWRRVVRSILANATPSYDALRSPARTNLALLPFQLEPVLAIVRGLATRLLIADEVGLGKTIQAGLVISEVLERRPDARILVVTPAGLRDQWQSELRDRFGCDSTLLDSASIARQPTHWNGNPWSVPGVVLTSLDYVKRPEVVRALEALIWDVVVFDEAHALAGRSDRATVAGILARRARTLLLLSATPHSGDEDAFRRLTSLGDVSDRFPLLVFRRTRSDVGMTSTRRTLSLRVRPTTHELETHRVLLAYARLVWKQPAAMPAARLAMSVLTRRACSSASSLARSLETRLRLLSGDAQPDVLQIALPFGDSAMEDDEPNAELSSPGLTDRDEERGWLERLLQLARLAEATESKIAALRRLLRRAGEPAIVFTEYRDTLRQVAHRLHDLDPVQLHGGMTSGERHEVLRRFVSGDVRVLLATDAASEGLNLHHRCRLVINLELPWTPVRLEQRIGRVERLGQSKRVHAVHLLAANTCEEASVAVLLARMQRVANVLGNMRTAAYDERIAAASIGESPDDALVVTPVALPAGVVVGDLRTTAIAEAARLEDLRKIAGHETTDGRPCVTVLTSHRARRRPHWAYRLVFEDSDLQPLWTTVIGIEDGATLWPPSNDAIRQRIGLLVSISEDACSPVTERLLSSFVAAFHQSQSLALERERAIAEALRQQRARLATSLLQPGLFDHRAERAAAAQNATLDHALERSAHRLAELGRFGPISIDRRLAFGLVRR
jgi:superfamily II DNA or RNA helicase